MKNKLKLEPKSGTKQLGVAIFATNVRVRTAVRFVFEVFKCATRSKVQLKVVIGSSKVF
jgi:hypothetical protein